MVLETRPIEQEEANCGQAGRHACLDPERTCMGEGAGACRAKRLGSALRLFSAVPACSHAGLESCRPLSPTAAGVLKICVLVSDLGGKSRSSAGQACSRPGAELRGQVISKWENDG